MIVKKAFSNEELQDAFRLRYQVYCIERGYEDPRDYPHDLEVDEYDPYAIHFVAYSESGPVGTARLILHNPLGFPVEKHCSVDPAAVCNTKNVVEISRFAVSSERARQFSVNRSAVTLGIIAEIFKTMRDLGIVCYFAAMSSGLERLLSRCGLPFKKAGPPVEYHGLRTPYYCLMEDIVEVFTRQGGPFEPFMSPVNSIPDLSLVST